MASRLKHGGASSLRASGHGRGPPRFLEGGLVAVTLRPAWRRGALSHTDPAAVFDFIEFPDGTRKMRAENRALGREILDLLDRATAWMAGSALERLPCWTSFLRLGLWRLGKTANARMTRWVRSSHRVIYTKPLIGARFGLARPHKRRCLFCQTTK